jgi:UDP-N-acetylmuramoylalanine--D-glutamate ligase
MGVLRYLHQHGRFAAFYDDQPKATEVEEATALGFYQDPSPKPGFYKAVIAAPGVAMNHPRVLELQAAGAVISGEAELAYSLSPTPLIGITGTAGKGSSTVMTAHFLQALGFAAGYGGNFDPPLVSVVDAAEVVAVELSSFQLERIQNFKPRVAVLLNLGNDHLDRHGSLEAYHGAKLNLIKNLSAEDGLVYNQDDQRIVAGIKSCPAQKIGFIPDSNPRQTNLRASRAAAEAFARLMGKPVDSSVLDQASQTAPRLEGRFETFAQKGNLFYIEDSIATRYDAVRAALSAAPAPIAWILGGLDKQAPVADLLDVVKARVRVILAIGRDGPRLADVFREHVEVLDIAETDGRITLRQAIQAAEQRLESGSILLAPLATSFDQFKDYKERGKVFKQVVFESGAVPIGEFHV